MNDFDSEYYIENKLNCKNDIDIFSICFIVPTFINTFIKNFMETFRHYFVENLQYLNIYIKKYVLIFMKKKFILNYCSSKQYFI